MRYFVAYSPSDFPFTLVDARARLLVSPTTFAPTFAYPGPPPQALLIDSGAYHHGSRRGRPSWRHALDRQLGVLEQFAGVPDVGVLHLDVIARDDLSPARAVRQTRANAEGFVGAGELPLALKVGVAQARDPEELFEVVTFLRELGFARLALGGLARMSYQKPAAFAQMLAAARAASERVPLHVLGVAGKRALPVLRAHGVSSCDSATPAWTAIYGSLLYSGPLRRLRLRQSVTRTIKRTGFYTFVDEAPPCACPACALGVDLAGRDKIARFARAAHNYLHLKREIEGAWGEWPEPAAFQDALNTTFKTGRVRAAAP